jgi:hypothetical protein
MIVIVVYPSYDRYIPIIIGILAPVHGADVSLHS